MGWYDDPYSSPEKHGLSVLGEVDFSDGCYQFDYTVVWRRDADGQLFYDDDAGCSCPSPFEGVKGTEDMVPCTTGSLQAHLEERNKANEYYGDRSASISELMVRVVG